MEVMWVLFLGFILLLLVLQWKNMRPQGFLPGPWTLPLIGNLLQVDLKQPLQDFCKIQQEYGDVYSFYFFGTPSVIVNGLQAMKDVLVTRGTEFANRPKNPVGSAITKNRGIITAHFGSHWKEQRRLVLSILRNFGFGKKSMEERILEEIHYLLESFNHNKGMPFNPHNLISHSVSNIICSIVLGKRYAYEGHEGHTLHEILKLVDENMKLSTSIWGQLYNGIPIVRYLPLPHQKILTNADTILSFLSDIIEEHKQTLTPGEPRDLIDSYLEEIEKQKDTEPSLDEADLLGIVLDLFIAGTESTAATLMWGILYMMAFPDVQVRCHAEIDVVLGETEALRYDDRHRLPYVQAMVCEVQRFANVVPLGVAHACVNDTTLSGYKIPKDTMVITNLASVHAEKSQWKFPQEFNPSNFLNDKGEFVKPEAFLPFGAGPRVCLGENLARMELFLFFTALLKHFEFFWPSDSKIPDLTPIFGLTQSPKPFKVGLKWHVTL